jgi:succinate dehydrogenase/fumarate reductase cytochrome b subunit
MRYNFPLFIIYLIGAFVLWAFSGFRKKFNDFMPHFREYNKKSNKTLITGFITLVLFLFIAIKLINFFNPPQTTNSKTINISIDKTGKLIKK